MKVADNPGHDVANSELEAVLFPQMSKTGFDAFGLVDQVGSGINPVAFQFASDIARGDFDVAKIPDPFDFSRLLESENIVVACLLRPILPLGEPYGRINEIAIPLARGERDVGCAI